MMGALLRRLVIWPIPPAYSGRAAAISLVTVAMIALTEVHGFGGVLAVALAATGLVLGIEAVILSHRRAK